MQSVADDEVAAAGALIARAFHHDPLNVHLYPDEADVGASRRACSRRSSATTTCSARSTGSTTSRRSQPGSARGSRKLPERLTQAGFDELPGEVPTDELAAVFSVIAAAVELAAPGPHWHLRLLAVDPAVQSRGIGASLLEHGLQRAHADGRRAPRASQERTVPFYVRNGFEVVLEDVEPTFGLRYWVLRHD